VKTILIVEDLDINIELLTQILEDSYHVIIATDGAMGVSMVFENNPDLVLMDVSLPIMDGYIATQNIRKSLIDLPIIGLSAHAMQADIDKALSLGFTDYITKPIDEDLLLKKLQEYLD